MRVGEAIRLDRADVRLGTGVVRVLASKLGKSREVLLHPSAADALGRYELLRDRLCPAPRAHSFLLSSAGTRLIYCNVASTFRKLSRTAGLRPRSARCRPRIHDLRHSFAVKTVVGWLDAGADVQALLPLLSTWMGHVDARSTYWYLSAAPELLGVAARRLEDAFGGDR
jgi:integrase